MSCACFGSALWRFCANPDSCRNCGLAFAGPLAALFAPGFIGQPRLFTQLTELVRITFPYLGFISLTAYAGALLNAHGRFALPALTPVMLNVCLTLAALLGLMGHLQTPPIVILAWSVLVAGILQCSIQLPSLARLHLLPKPVVSTSHPGMKQVGQMLVRYLFRIRRPDQCLSKHHDRLYPGHRQHRVAVLRRSVVGATRRTDRGSAWHRHAAPPIPTSDRGRSEDFCRQ